MEKINNVSLDIIDLIREKLGGIDVDDESVLYDLIVDLLEKFYQYPDYTHFN